MLRASIALALLVGPALSTSASATAIDSVGDVFVIDMENHNFTQPNSTALNTTDGKILGVSQGIQQLKGNIADPFLNSLVTPGAPNAAQTS
jgi:hypothetical protein